MVAPCAPITRFTVKLPKLETLFLRSSKLQEIPTASQLPALRFLDVSDCMFLSENALTFHHSRIRALLFAFNSARSLSLRTTRLEYLNLNGSTLTRLEGLGRMRRLRTLLMASASVPLTRELELPKSLEVLSLPSLAALARARAPDAPGAGPDLSRCPLLSRLYVPGGAPIPALDFLPETVGFCALSALASLTGAAAAQFWECEGVRARLCGDFEVERADGTRVRPNVADEKPAEPPEIPAPHAPTRPTSARPVEATAVFPHTEFARSTEEALGQGEVSRERVAGMIIGAAVGDALGLCSEFHDMGAARFYQSIGPVPAFALPHGVLSAPLVHASLHAVDPHRLSWVPGDWTDDTDQAIVFCDAASVAALQHLKDALAQRGEVDPHDIEPFFFGLRSWVQHGIPELGDRGGSGIGRTVGSVVMSPTAPEDPMRTARQVWIDGGRRAAANGALMRFWAANVMAARSLPETLALAQALATVTHSDPRAYGAALAASTAAFLLVRGCELEAALAAGLAAAALALHDEACDTPLGAALSQLAFYGRAATPDSLPLSPASVGFAYKTLGAAFSGLRAAEGKTFEEAIARVARCAGDADTNCAVLGALLGAQRGVPPCAAQALFPTYRRWLHARLARWGV